jgi:hypothetical protein
MSLHGTTLLALFMPRDGAIMFTFLFPRFHHSGVMLTHLHLLFICLLTMTSCTGTRDGPEILLTASTENNYVQPKIYLFESILGALIANCYSISLPCSWTILFLLL